MATAIAKRYIWINKPRLPEKPRFVYLPLRNRSLALQAQRQILLHLLNTHAALFQADQAANPRNIPLVKHPAVIPIPLDIGNKPFVAIKFQRLIGHIGLFTDLHHGVKHKNFLALYKMFKYFFVKTLDRL